MTEKISWRDIEVYDVNGDPVSKTIFENSYGQIVEDSGMILRRLMLEWRDFGCVMGYWFVDTTQPEGYRGWDIDGNPVITQDTNGDPLFRCPFSGELRPLDCCEPEDGQIDYNGINE